MLNLVPFNVKKSKMKIIVVEIGRIIIKNKNLEISIRFFFLKHLSSNKNPKYTMMYMFI